jgi:hypothetical protein
VVAVSLNLKPGPSRGIATWALRSVVVSMRALAALASESTRPRMDRHGKTSPGACVTLSGAPDEEPDLVQFRLGLLEAASPVP